MGTWRQWSTTAALTLLVAGACADPSAVTVDDRSATKGTATRPVSTSTPDPPISAPTTTVAPTTTDVLEPGGDTTTTSTTTSTSVAVPEATTPALEFDEVDPDDPDVLVFDLDRFDVVTRLRTTQAETPPLGYNGFAQSIVLSDGTLMASGFDATADGFQPERSALWTSADGERWERSGLELGGPVGQQTIQALFLDAAGTPTVALSDVNIGEDSDGTTDVEFGLTVEWRRGSSGWGSRELIGDAAIVGSYESPDDGTIVLYGVTDPNQDGEFTGAVFTSSPGEPWRDRPIDVDGDGAPISGSIVTDITVLADGTLLAVGATTATDPLGDVDAEYIDTQLSLGFTDVGIWTQSPGTDRWSRIDTDPFTDVSGGALALDVVQMDGTIYMLARTTEAYRQLPTLWRSDDSAESWDQVPFDRAVTGNLFDGSQGSFASLSSVDGFLVVIDEVLTFDGPRAFLTVLDPTNDDSVTHDLAERFGLHQMESVLDIGPAGLVFGRIERGPDDSDLQLLELIRTDTGETPSAEPSGA